MGKPDWKYNPLRDAGISLVNQEDTARADHADRARQDQYAGDVQTLAAIFRTQRQERPASRAEFATMLRYVATVLVDGWGATDALYPQSVFDDHGPAAILMALKQAYDHPAPIVSDVVEFP